jgi:hypothetical protein|nr:MAG TPA: hypothetical protein [Caudoviricetes sp.]
MRTLLSPGGVEVNASDEDVARLIACGFTEPEESKPAAKPKPTRKAPAKTTTKRKA